VSRVVGCDNIGRFTRPPACAMLQRRLKPRVLASGLGENSWNAESSVGRDDGGWERGRFKFTARQDGERGVIELGRGMGCESSWGLRVDSWAISGPDG
jgi:hypothetical protein